MQLAIAKNNIIKLQEENQQLRSENSIILLKAQQQLEVHSHTRTNTKLQKYLAVWKHKKNVDQCLYISSFAKAVTAAKAETETVVLAFNIAEIITTLTPN